MTRRLQFVDVLQYVLSETGYSERVNRKEPDDIKNESRMNTIDDRSV